MLTTLLISLSLAAPGDVIYLAIPGQEIEGEFVKDPPIILDEIQKPELASAVASTFPGVKPGTLDKYVCWANAPEIKNKLAVNLQELAATLPWPCNAVDADPVKTDEEVLELELATGPGCSVRDLPDGNSHLYCELPAMSADAKILNDAFTQLVFEQSLSLVSVFRCDRAPGDNIACGYKYVKIAPVAVWRADRKLGRAFGKPLGKVSGG